MMPPQNSSNGDEFPDSLGIRLRALDPPPVPAGLEARLIAAIPAAKQSRATEPARHQGILAGAFMSLAAASLLVVLALPQPSGRVRGVKLLVKPSASDVKSQFADKHIGESFEVAGWQQARRSLEGAKWPSFDWPIHEKSPLMVSTAIPFDLLD